MEEQVMNIGEIVRVGEREIPVFNPKVTPLKEDPPRQQPAPETVPEREREKVPA
jgi:hypothetical protein